MRANIRNNATKDWVPIKGDRLVARIARVYLDLESFGEGLKKPVGKATVRNWIKDNHVPMKEIGRILSLLKMASVDWLEGKTSAEPEILPDHPSFPVQPGRLTAAQTQAMELIAQAPEADVGFVIGYLTSRRK